MLSETGFLAYLVAPPGEMELDRLLAEKSLYEFVMQAWSQVEAVPFLDNWHIEAICKHLEAVTAGDIPKLLVNIPPGCSKSLLTCVFWPMWEWVNDPSIRWIFASYDQRLATRDSVRCRALLESPWFQERWGDRFSLTADQNQKTYYETTAGGYRLATSIGGHGTGEHPDRIVVDDPNNVKGAESELEREAVIEWWDLTMSTRGVARGSRRVIIMQRLNEKDLSGHVLAQGGYDHICLPMRYEAGRMEETSLAWTDPRQDEGELLCPEQFDEEKLQQMEGPLGPYGTAGQMQQRPVPRGGALFKPEWFRFYTIDTHNYHLGSKVITQAMIRDRFLTVDPAGTEQKTSKHDPDYTVISAWAISMEGHLIWTGCVRLRIEIPDIAGRVAESYIRHRASRAYIEGVGMQKGVPQLAQRHPLPNGGRMSVVEFTPRGPKLVQATDALSMMEAGRVWLPSEDRSFPLAEVQDELCRFTGDSKKDAHDDVVDTLSRAAEVLARHDVERQPAGRPGTIDGTKRWRR